jgi:hypothetical protein
VTIEDNRKYLHKPEELKYVDYECKNGVAEKDRDAGSRLKGK